jgi:hypothetical protein
LRGRCPQLLDHLRPRLAQREATVRHTGPTHRGRLPERPFILRTDSPLVAFVRVLARG